MTFEEKMTLWAGILTVAKWVYEYSKKMKWEKNKFLLERIEIFKQRSTVKLMHKLLDWNAGVEVEINGEKISIDDKILFEAMQTHDKKEYFSDVEYYLREVFDDYFDNLNELVLLTKSGLIDEKNLRVFLQYWLEILSGEKKSKSFSLVNQFKIYLNYYGYSELHFFIMKKISK